MRSHQIDCVSYVRGGCFRPLLYSWDEWTGAESRDPDLDLETTVRQIPRNRVPDRIGGDRPKRNWRALNLQFDAIERQRIWRCYLLGLSRKSRSDHAREAPTADIFGNPGDVRRSRNKLGRVTGPNVNPHEAVIRGGCEGHPSHRPTARPP